MTFRALEDRTGQAFVNDDQPSSWSVVLVLGSVFHAGAAIHKVLVTEAGPRSGYEPGDVEHWPEHLDERAWDDGYGYMRRIA